VAKKKSKKSKKTETRELDLIWKTKVKERDNHRCQVCGKKLEPKSCHAHHLLPKHLKGKKTGLRWDIDNGITLCPYHHKFGPYAAHQNAIWFYGWLNEHKPKELKYCIQKLKEIGEKNESCINSAQ